MNNDLEQWLNKSNDYSNEIYFYTEESIKLKYNFNYGKITIINNIAVKFNYMDNVYKKVVSYDNLPRNIWNRGKSYQTIKDFIEDTDINFFNKETNPELFI